MKLGVAAAAVMLLRMAWHGRPANNISRLALTAQYNTTSYGY
jgi:hypothetical protein